MLVVARCRNDPHFKEREYINAAWWLDYQAPHRFLVSQHFVDHALGDAFDQWISIGDATYQNAGMWYRAEDGAHRDFADRYSLDALPALLQGFVDKVPQSTGVCTDRGARYVYLLYSELPIGDPRSGLMDDGGRPLTVATEIWIRETPAHLSKVRIAAEGSDATGNPLRFEEERVFCCYNEPIRVDPPPWLNAVPTDGGRMKVVDNRVPLVRHYGASGCNIDNLVSVSSDTDL